MRDGLVTLFLCGDVMPGRGVDQILAHPGDPELREGFVQDARSYVGAAEAVNGPITRPVPFAWPWGNALGIIDGFAPDARVINLEASITRCNDFAVGKAIHYRMNPDNVRCLAVGRPDVCVLANNHVLDFGVQGLVDTLDTLGAAGLRVAGAGRDAEEARREVAISAGGGRVVVLACGMTSSGVPASWAAGPDRPGVNFVADLTQSSAAEITGRVQEHKRPGDVVLVSIHWGANWGYHVPDEQIHFAHQLIDGGVDIVHGHSSHHPRPIEVYRGKLVLYGCGDFIDDYEGISGYERYRDDLRLLYFASVEAGTGALSELRMVLMQARQMRLCHASSEDTRWLRDVLTRISDHFGTRAEVEQDALTLRWRGGQSS